MSLILDAIRIAASFEMNATAGALSGQIAQEYAAELDTGNADGEANTVVIRELSIAAGVPLDIDLSAVADASGATVAFTKLVGWMLQNFSETTGEYLTVGGGSNPIIAADVEPVHPDGNVLIRTNIGAGWTVDGTHKTFRIAAAAGTIAGRLILLGRKA